MRTYTENGVTIKYPDIIAFAFDTIGINITLPSDGDCEVEVEHDSGNGNTYTDTRTSIDNKVSFDIAPYVRAIMSQYIDTFFEGQYGGTMQSIKVQITAGGVTFTTTIYAVWGSCPMNEVWNKSKTIHLWSDYPNIYGFFVLPNTIVGSKTYASRGIAVNQVPVSASVVFVDGMLAPTLYCDVTDDTLTTNAGNPLEGVELTCESGTFSVDGTKIKFTTSDIGKIDFAINAPDGWKVDTWQIYAVNDDDNYDFNIANSTGSMISLSYNNTITNTEVNRESDKIYVYSTAGGSFYIETLYVTLAKIADTSVSAGTQTASASGFLTYERTGRLSVLGEDSTFELTFVDEGTCENGLFLRWIGRDGFPVSWLFKPKDESYKTKITEILRSNMDGQHLDNGVNGAMTTIAQMSETITLPAAHPLASEDEYEILRGVLVSPVVEMWNGENWLRVNIAATTNTRKGAIHEDFVINVTIPSEHIQRL